MRSAVVAMLMAGAMAVPSAHRAHMRVHEAREAHPEEVVVTATAYTTVMAGAAPTVVPAAQEKVVTVSAPAANAPPAPSAYSAPPPVQASGPAPSAPAPSAPSSGSNTAGLNSFQKTVIDVHNQHRANHSAGPLSYDTGLESAAMQLASNCQWGSGTHDTSISAGSAGQYGQNAACGDNIADVITGMWYNNEVMAYTFFGSEPPQSVFEATGHFTQLVWKSSTKVGCAIAQCPNGVVGWPSAKAKAICNYATPGNFAGQYAQNVLPALGHAGMSSNAGNVVNT